MLATPSRRRRIRIEATYPLLIVPSFMVIFLVNVGVVRGALGAALLLCVLVFGLDLYRRAR